MALIDVLEAVSKKTEDLFVLDLDGTEVCFRLPTYKQASQYAGIIKQANNNYSLKSLIYEHIFQKFVQNEYLATEDGDVRAGIVETIALVILRLSGVEDNFREYTEDLLDVFREHSNTVISIMCSRICSIFGGYKISDLMELNFQELVQVYVHAEKILLENGIIQEGLKFANPEENKPVNIANVISKDAKDYNRFEQETPRRKLTDTPEYQQKAEQFAQKMKKMGR
jgi:hypothetical protein